jgi:hypothetical protein
LADEADNGLRLKFGVLCDYAMISGDGKLSIVGIFDHLGVMQLPVQHPRFFIVAVLEGQASSSTVEMELTAPDGRALTRQEITIDPDAIAAGSGNLLAEVTMLPFELAGRYAFRVHADGALLGEMPLTVDVMDMPQQPPLHLVPHP